jgi:PPOX class probable F420-dependent enzyme
MLIDTATDFGQRVQQRLQDEKVIWLTTVTSGGQPLPVPVWFLWDGDAEVLIYSQPDTPKLRNISNQPKVGLNLNSDSTGGNVIQFAGEAREDAEAPSATGVEAFIEKYRDGIQSLGSTPEGFASNYSAAVRVRLTKLRGH